MSRAVAPVIGIAALLVVTAGLGAVGAVFVAADMEAPDAVEPVAIDVEADAEGAGTIQLTHRRGPHLDVEELSFRIAVEDASLQHQPTVPFFSAIGFGVPTGPFNLASDSTWRSGESGTISLASTNHPTIDAGDAVTVTITRGDHTVAQRTVTAS